MVRICYSKSHSGDRIFGEKEPFKDRSETHGLCNGCLRLELENIKKRKKEVRKDDKMDKKMD